MGFSIDWSKPLEDTQCLLDNVYSLSHYEVPEHWPNYSAYYFGYNDISECNIDLLSNEILVNTPVKKYVSRTNITGLATYSLITRSWLDKLANFIGTGKCLEVMCGNGMMSSELAKRGVDIVATTLRDLGRPWNKDIIYMDALEAIKTYIGECQYLIMSWPPYDNITDYKCLCLLRQLNPNCKIIYIGEIGRCCGTKLFCDSIGEGNIALIEELNNPNDIKHWHATLRDQVYIINP